LQVPKDLHLGQTVRFMGWRDGQMPTGRVIAKTDTPLTLQEAGSRSSWAVPYPAVELPAPAPSRRRLCAPRAATSCCSEKAAKPVPSARGRSARRRRLVERTH